MNSSIIIRPFAKEDALAIQNFFDEMGPESAGFFNVNHGNEKRCMGYYDGSTKDHRFFTAMEGNVCVGLMFIWDLECSVPCFGIAVRDGMQGKGIGTGMIEWLKNYLVDNGYAGLLLDTATTNYPARYLYEKCGFEHIGTHPSGEMLYILRMPKRKV